MLRQLYGVTIVTWLKIVIIIIETLKSAQILGPHLDIKIPPAGFLWSDVGDGEAAKEALGEAAIKTVPGELMGRDGVNGKNPGKPYLRIALVYEPKVTELGLTRMVKTLFG